MAQAVEWIREQRPKGDAWMDRKSSTERRDSEFLRVRDSWCRLLEDLGLSYKFVSYSGLENGDLARGGYRVLILPRSSALSEAEAEAIRAFAESGGLVIAEGEPGVYDEHCGRLPTPRLAGLSHLVRVDALGYDRERVLGSGAPLREKARKLRYELGLRPNFTLDGAPGIRLYEFRNGGAELVALLNNPPIEQDELGPLKIQSQKQFEKTNRVRLVISEPAYAYDLRTHKFMGKAGELSVTLDPYEPAIFAFTSAPLPKLRVRVPARVRRGGTAGLALAFDSSSPAEADVLHVEMRNPQGEFVRYFSLNVLARHSSASKSLPVAWNEQTGRWSVQVTDVLSGEKVDASFEVY